MGYRIPLEYRKVAKLWLATEDHRIREVGRRALVSDPRNWVVVVAYLGSTHYTDREATGRIESLIGSDAFQGKVISTMYVGDPTE